MEDTTKRYASLASGTSGQYEAQMGAQQSSMGGAQQPLGSGNAPGQQKGMMRNMSERRLRISFIVAMALVVGLGLFVAMIIASYPDSGDQAIPVVRADKVAFKERPAQPGGMDIANRESTVYDSFRSSRSANAVSSERDVENLLRNSGQPMDKLEAFAQQVEEKIKEQEMERQASLDMMRSEQEIASADESEILQQISPAAGDDASSGSVKPGQKPTVIHKPGQSPDTIEFVRSVLEKKKMAAASDADAAKVAAVEPAAGAAISAPKYTSGLYFVQLASIRERSSAAGEWSKIVKQHPVALQDVKYRVMKAELPSGTFYRIQAGPFSKESANQVCNAVKARKAGGCFVLK